MSCERLQSFNTIEAAEAITAAFVTLIVTFGFQFVIDPVNFKGCTLHT